MCQLHFRTVDMIKIGKTNRLKVLRCTEFATYLDAEHLGEVKLIEPSTMNEGEFIDAFIFKDTNEQICATTQIPFAELDECAYLEVVGETDSGVFLNWNIAKDLFVPRQQQQVPMQMGRRYVVAIYLDEKTQRLAASSKLSHYLLEFSKDFEQGEPVNLLISGRSELGYKAVINHTHLGLIYHADVFQPLKIGQRVEGYIKQLRPDYKIDLTLQTPGQDARKSLQDKILNYLNSHGGKSDITDKSPPEEIYKLFSVSKSNYKKALGALYRQKKISINKKTILLN